MEIEPKRNSIVDVKDRLQRMKAAHTEETSPKILYKEIKIKW